MSDTIWLEVYDGREKTGGDRDNSIMLKLAEDLDTLAGKLGVAKSSSFYDNSALAADNTRSFSQRLLREELEACHASLVEAEQRGHRFHFLVVP